MNTKILKQLQDAELEILLEIDKFCAEHELNYSLYEGTAIGAVRHNGFIPWDDDIDICMIRKDYEKFQDCWNSNPIKGYYMQGTRISDFTNINHIKICKNDTLYTSKEQLKKPGHHGIWIDIFALDKVPIKEKSIRKQTFWGKVRLIYTRNEPMTRSGKIVELITKVLLAFPKGIKRAIRKKAELEVTKYLNAEDWSALKSFNSVGGVSSKGFSKSCLDEFETINFEGYNLSISSEYDKMLRASFGDYMQLPPIEQQVPSHQGDIIKF